MKIFQLPAYIFFTALLLLTTNCGKEDGAFIEEFFGTYQMVRSCEVTEGGNVIDSSEVPVEAFVTFFPGGETYADVNPSGYQGPDEFPLDIQIIPGIEPAYITRVFVKPSGEFKAAKFDPNETFTGMFNLGSLSIESFSGGLGGGTTCIYD